MKVTDLQIGMDEKLLEKLDLMCDRMSDKRKSDNLLLVEGNEGEGKTNTSVIVAKYVADKTGRVFDNSRIFFDVGEMTEFAKSTEAQIIIWDEPALAGLTTEWWKSVQRDLVKLLMVCRKKRHFFIFNLVKFHRFQEYIVLDRAIGMIHMYSPDGIEVGRWAYFKKESLEKLYYYWRSTRRRAYKKFYDFRGKLSWYLPKIINEQEYEKAKDDAIMSIGETTNNKAKEKENYLKWKISMLQGIHIEEIAKHMNVTPKTIWEWRKIPKKYPEIKEYYE